MDDDLTGGREEVSSEVGQCGAESSVGVLCNDSGTSRAAFQYCLCKWLQDNLAHTPHVHFGRIPRKVEVGGCFAGGLQKNATERHGF